MYVDLNSHKAYLIPQQQQQMWYLSKMTQRKHKYCTFCTYLRSFLYCTLCTSSKSQTKFLAKSKVLCNVLRVMFLLYALLIVNFDVLTMGKNK